MRYFSVLLTNLIHKRSSSLCRLRISFKSQSSCIYAAGKSVNICIRRTKTPHLSNSLSYSFFCIVKQFQLSFEIIILKITTKLVQKGRKPRSIRSRFTGQSFLFEFIQVRELFFNRHNFFASNLQLSCKNSQRHAKHICIRYEPVSVPSGRVHTYAVFSNSRINFFYNIQIGI